MSKIRFVFAGRLVKEKWADLLLSAIEQLARKDDINNAIEIIVYGKWYLSDNFSQLAEQYTFVQYHWFRPKKELYKTREESHYTIMPSRFLETFGLSALESLSAWVPVIWFQKWWLNQFIDDDFAIEEVDDFDEQVELFTNKIRFLVKHFTKQKYTKQTKKARVIYKDFTRESRIGTFEKFLPKWVKNILLVSDYNADIWWIENWLLILKDKLEKNWYTVTFFWWWRGNVSHRGVFYNLFLTACNISATRRLRNTIKQTKPDLIWWHSIHRVLWWLPLSLLYKRTHLQWIMYHDFWLFHPYPSQVYSENQLIKSRDFIGFMREWVKKWWWRAPLLICKWISYAVIRYFLKRQIDLHLVPSPFMLPIVQNKWYIWTHAAMDVLPHFINPSDHK